MVQSGLYVPAEFGTELSVFDAVYADIGDEQSIEQSLSTFSSHMTNIVGMLDKIDFMSLVLFDELGAGTDPQEGAALAIAILDEVKRRGARVAATTHYSELKAYAYNREGVMNASMEFDIESLSPTYRLLIGVPGRSNAFEISRRLGLSEQVIDKARSHVGSDAESVESMINELEAAKQRAEQLEQELIVKRHDFEEEQAAFEAKMTEFERERDNLYSAAEAKAEKAVEQAKRQANEVIDRLKKLREQGIVKEHEIIAAKKELESAKPTLQEKKIQKVKQKAQQKRTFSKGEEVKVTTFNQKGYIVKQINDNEYNVQVGIMKVNVKADDLQKIGPSKEKSLQSKGSSLKRQSSTKSELDLRGVRVEEGLMRLDKYIDEALVSGYDNVRIIHGLGTGAMRQATQEFLKGHRHVKSQRPGGMGEGGLGVTVVELK
jgi:DNA mismatch repair protein MutS2